MRIGCHIKQYSKQRNLLLCRARASTGKPLFLNSTMITTSTFFRQSKAWLTQNLLVPTAQNVITLAGQSLKTTNSRTTLSLGLVAAGAGIFALAKKWRDEEHTFRFIEKINSNDCGLATDHLEDGYGAVGDQAEIDHHSIDPRIDTESGRNVAKLLHKAVEVASHRRVRAGRGLKYMNCVLAECKSKFGTPAQNEANRKAIQRYAQNIMNKHGLRPSHIRQYLPMVVSMTFVPTQEEMDALAMLNSAAAVSRKVQYLISDLSSGFVNVN